MLDSAAVTLTVATAAMWSTMTTADFENYDVIWIGGSDCSGTLSSVYGTAQDTVATWGPAVTGRTVIISGDPDYHGGAAATQFFRNSAAWLSQLGRDADNGRTGLFFSWGCTQVNTPYAAGARGTPEQFASVLGAGITGGATNYCAAYTTTAGSTSPVLSGITTYWSCPTHGSFGSLPSDFTALALGSSPATGDAVIAAREYPGGCVSPP